MPTLLLDIGNTNTHLGIGGARKILKHADMPTRSWFDGTARQKLSRFAKGTAWEGAALCSVVPRATARAVQDIRALFSLQPLVLGPKTLRGVGIRYPKPSTIGPDRLANAAAAYHFYGAPSVVVDFGTAVTFDVVDHQGNYVGGIIAPGLASMTEYLHEKTALLPRIRIRQPRRVIGRSTEQAMLSGAVHGYRGLIRELIAEVRRELGARRLPVVATGGYAELLARHLKEIDAVDPLLTLEGLRLVWQAHHKPPKRRHV